MKESNQKQYAGVWMDNVHAIIMTRNVSEDSHEFSILEKVKAIEHHGGSSEHGINSAKQMEEQRYFKSVSAHLLPYDEILVFGTGMAQEQFQNFLKEDAQFNHKKIVIDSSEHLTDPQMIAKVGDYFKGHQ